MGLIQSIFCSISFCIERVLTWVCCATVLIMLLFTLVMIIIYGITVGYHYAQKELTSFAEKTRNPNKAYYRRMGAMPSMGPADLEDSRAIESETIGDIISAGLDMYRTKQSGGISQLFWDTGATSPVTVVDEERVEYEVSTDLSPHEKDLARRLLGRVRRSRKNSTSKKTNNIVKIFRKYPLT